MPHDVDLYRHNDLNVRRQKLDPDAPECMDGHSHVRAALFPRSVSLDILSGQIDLGRWQGVILLDFDGPRDAWRQVRLTIWT